MNFKNFKFDLSNKNKDLIPQVLTVLVLVLVIIYFTMTENTIGFIYNEHEKNADKFKVFDQFVDESKEKISKAADNLIILHKSDKLNDETRSTLKSLEKKLRLVFKEIDDIDKEVEDIAKRFRLDKLS